MKTQGHGGLSLAYKSRRDWRLWFFHPNYVEHRKYPGWKDFLAFYKVGCEKHGMQVSYEHGYRKKLVCPECASKRSKR